MHYNRQSAPLGRKLLRDAIGLSDMMTTFIRCFTCDM